MLKKIGIPAIAVFVVLAVVIATRPAAYRISRSQLIGAPSSVIYAQVADFQRWKEWSPWEKLDPNLQTTYTGTPGVAGASYAWKGNDSVGEGRMTLVEARPGERIGIRLEFIKPISSTAATRFDFVPEGEATRATWTMEGRNDFAGKAFSLVMSMDKMVGGDFERGLSQLKAVSEAQAQKAPGGSAAR
jgi:hypothetical protein